MQTAYLLPLTALSLTLAVAALGVGARRRRGYAPLAVGVAAAVLVVLGKFVLDTDLATYGGVALLVTASVWNSWPRTMSNNGPRPPRDPAGPLLGIGITQAQHLEEVSTM